MRKETDEVNDAIFAELTYHAAYEPQRAIRTKRWKYIRRFGDRELPVLANIDDGPTKDLFIAERLGRPAAAARGAVRPAVRPLRGAQPGRRAGARRRARRDAGAAGGVDARRPPTRCSTATSPPPPGAVLNDPGQRSASESPAAEPHGVAALTMLHPEIQAILDAMNAAPGPPAHEVPVAEARAGARGRERASCAARASRWPRCATSRVPAAGGDVLVRAFRPEGDGPLPVVAYLHGGGWMMGSVDSYDAPLRALANATGAIVAGVEYRLAPEHRFPAALEDSLAAIRWLAAHAGELGGDGSRLAVAGDSAGGNLAAVAARRLRGELPIALQVLIYPVTDAGAQPAVLPRVRRRPRAQRGEHAPLLGPLPRRRRRQRPGRLAAARGRPRGRGAGAAC